MSSAGDYSFDIAIIGMSGRFPGAKNLEEFWQRLAAGEELITKFSHDDLLSRGLDRASLDDPAWVKAEGSLEGVDLFDAAFFDFSPREAESMDPQQRLFLEAAWEALENAAYDPDTYEGRIGVYAGSSLNSYLPYNLQSNPGLLETLGPFQLIIGGGTDHLPTQVSYKLNLTGPSVNVQTACSTSLVAVHLACQSLLGRECDIALAGGVSVSVPQGQGYRFEDGSIMSPDGHCRTFDANAAGTVPASGLGIVVLKRLSEALADRDFIHAVIKGTAINNDGGEKAGYTAPSVEGQATVIQEALAAAGVDADSIQYVEAHGTATPLGDPIEVAGLTRAFRSSTDRNQFCRIGSLKTNVGHLDAASGIGGLIKTVLALEHQQLPPTLHFRDPNPKIDFKQSPFFVDTSLAPWPSNGTPRLAGVSSFGIGGTNAHVIVGESQEAEVSQAVQGSTVPNRPWELIVVSARTPSALDSATRNLADALRQRSDLDLRDVAYTLRVGRKRFAHRRAVACESIEDAIAKLNSSVATAAALSQTTETRASTEERRPRVAFVFPGQGSQYVGMARDLYNLWPSFRDTVDRCCQILKPLIGVDLREVVFADHESTSTSNGKLDHTLVAQPALFVIEYSLARLWMELGIVPDSMIGHSIGEYVAACISGVFSLEAALALVAERARLMARVDGGTMLAVPLGEEAIQSFISRRQSVSVAAVNGPKLTVVSGATGAIEEVEQELRDAEIAAARLHVSHAFHSQMMDPVLDDFQNRVKSIKLNVPAIPYISNLTGTWITADQAMSASYYSDHL
ncbi:MAG TPA: type I polyketide synthase, partial [Blastocatellia bacterium]